jgi:hypothetical protein
MKKIRKVKWLLLLCFSQACFYSVSQVVTRVEARLIAQSWIQEIIQETGSWGGARSAWVNSVRDFRSEDRLLGFYVDIQPCGYIITSYRKELVPVKVYSDNSKIDPDSEQGMAALIKLKMEELLESLEIILGNLDKASPDSVAFIMGSDFRQSWDDLISGRPLTRDGSRHTSSGRNYEQGNVMLTTSWKQGNPYNMFCPIGANGGTTIVGCGPTALSQLVKFWDWPPYGENNSSYIWDGDQSCEGIETSGGPMSVEITDPFDWTRIANRYVYDTLQQRYEDENGNPLTSENLYAVAELCRDAGFCLEADYGVCATSTYFSDDDDALIDHFRYAPGMDYEEMSDYTFLEWFNLMKDCLNLNRPILYAIEHHGLVVDGWCEVGNPVIHQYHMNYGHDAGDNGWYSLEANPHPGFNYSIDEMLLGIYPAQALGSIFEGTFPKLSFPYRYFDLDAIIENAAFLGGQYLQFLPGIKLTAVSSSNYVRFYGLSWDNTRIYTRGDISRGIHLIDGTLRMKNGGTIKLH